MRSTPSAGRSKRRCGKASYPSVIAPVHHTGSPATDSTRVGPNPHHLDARLGRVVARVVLWEHPDMEDHDILDRITKLVEDEHALEQGHIGDGLSPDDQQRLSQLEVALDQCWDLLRHARARRSAGLDPDEADVRQESTVENYRQ